MAKKKNTTSTPAGFLTPAERWWWCRALYHGAMCAGWAVIARHAWSGGLLQLLNAAEVIQEAPTLRPEPPVTRFRLCTSGLPPRNPPTRSSLRPYHFGYNDLVRTLVGASAVEQACATTQHDISSPSLFTQACSHTGTRLAALACALEFGTQGASSPFRSFVLGAWATSEVIRHTHAAGKLILKRMKSWLTGNKDFVPIEPELSPAEIANTNFRRLLQEQDRELLLFRSRIDVLSQQRTQADRVNTNLREQLREKERLLHETAASARQQRIRECATAQHAAASQNAAQVESSRLVAVRSCAIQAVLDVFTHCFWSNHAQATQSGSAASFKLALNPHLVSESPLIRAFESGCADIGFQSVSDAQAAGQLEPAYHGTSVEAAQRILRDGFDPSTRQNQRKGPGEYFDTCPHGTTAKGYMKQDPNSPGAVIISLLLKPKAVTPAGQDTWRRVDNPTAAMTYCLPVAVLVHNAHLRRFAPAHDTAAQCLFRALCQSASPPTAPRSVEFLDDHGGWTPMAPKAALRIIQASHRHHGTVRVDTGGHRYSVHIGKCTQRNLDTNKVRKIRFT